MVTVEEMLEYVNQVNENPEIKKYGFRLVRSRNYRMFKFMGIVFLLITLCFVATIFYLGMEGKFGSVYESTINPIFNPEVKIENLYENKNEFNPSYTINIEIPDNLCGNVNDL